MRCKCCYKAGTLKVKLQGPAVINFGHNYSPHFNFVMSFEYEPDGTVQGSDICTFNVCQFKQLVKGQYTNQYGTQQLLSGQARQAQPRLPIHLTPPRVDDFYSIANSTTRAGSGVFETNDQPGLDWLGYTIDVDWYLNFSALVLDEGNYGFVIVLATKEDYWVMIKGVGYNRVGYAGGFD